MNQEVVETKLFKLGMWWRIIYGGIRLIAGLALLRLIDVPISDLLFRFSGSEVAEDPTNFLLVGINYILEAHPLSVTYFLAFYLIFWGIVEIALSISLLKHKICAFPVTLWIIGGFMTYVIYRYTQTGSPFLIGVFVVDIVIFWLIYHEYKRMHNNQKSPPAEISPN